MTFAHIAESVGVHESMVIRWIGDNKRDGVGTLKDKPLGRPMGTGRALSVKQKKRIHKLIADKTPDQLKMTCEQNPQQVKEWLEDNCLKIQAWDKLKKPRLLR